jgi:hypothetical protein
MSKESFVPVEIFPYIRIPETGHKYFLSDDNPTLLMASGTHGDENEIVPLVEEVVWKYLEQLPPFMFIPEISPSACELNTRKNKDGLDLNRSFTVPPPADEVKAMMDIWSNYKFGVFLTFHTDPKFTDFYLYDHYKDTGHKKRRLDTTESFALLKKDILSIGINMYNGIDDSEDPTLGYEVKDGYICWPMSKRTNNHSMDYWLIMDTGIVKQVINPEIPGKATLEEKSIIIESIIRRLILGEEE